MVKENHPRTSLFEYSAKEDLSTVKPLAARMRPSSFDEFSGQEKILGPGKVLMRAIQADALPSFVLWGPSGTGKTTIASLIAKTTRADFAAVSAVTSGVAELRDVIKKVVRFGQQREGVLFYSLMRFIGLIKANKT